MRKFLITLSCILALSSALAALAGCNATNPDGSIDVVCTIFPQYDWTCKLTEGAEDVNITLLQDSGIDLHNYQPTAADKVKIMNCDLLIFVGGESDKWVEDMLGGAKNTERKILRLLDEVNALDEEEVPGGEHDHEEEEGAKDEHVWLSLKNADVLCRAIAKALQQIDPENEILYENNMHQYVMELNALEGEYAAATADPARKILLFGDRFPFRYLAEDYGLTYFAAFSGCSAETEASFEVIKTLAEAADNNALPYILVLEGSDKKIAEQIRNSTSNHDQTILEMNSLQSVTRKQIGDGVSYLSLMRGNLETLKTVLN